MVLLTATKLSVNLRQIRKMEVDFDKEIDALLRREGTGRTITISEFAAPHLDADGIAAFAENALPEAARRSYMTHLADCDSCRNTFSGFIRASTDESHEAAATSAASIPAAAATAEPWYRRLFIPANLAYGMGALVLMFAGFLGYTLLQSPGSMEVASNTSSNAAPVTTTASGPMEDPLDEIARAETGSAVVSNANTAMAANRTASAQAPAANIAGSEIAKAAGQPTELTLDGIDSTAAAPPPPPPAVMSAPAAEAADVARSIDAEEKEDTPKVLQQQQQMPSAGNMPSTQAGPSRNVQRDNRSLELAKRRAEAPPGRTGSPSRTVSGKNFSKKEGVWYDSAYTGQATTNVRRNTAAYRDLDSGLRTIAESLDGVVVVLWRSKAYRIQ
jgi:predicted anti-sigma-YlaC factor YlaD